MIYVRNIDIDLVATRKNILSSAAVLARQGTCFDSISHDPKRCSVESSCTALAIRALQDFLDPHCVTHSRFLRPRLFIAPRLSDIAPGVFTPSYTRAIQSRQRLIPVIAKTLSLYTTTTCQQKSNADARPAAHRTGPDHELQSVEEEKLWSIMIRMLKAPRKPRVQRTQSLHEPADSQPSTIATNFFGSKEGGVIGEAQMKRTDTPSTNTRKKHHTKKDSYIANEAMITKAWDDVQALNDDTSLCDQDGSLLIGVPDKVNRESARNRNSTTTSSYGCTGMLAQIEDDPSLLDADSFADEQIPSVFYEDMDNCLWQQYDPLT